MLLLSHLQTVLTRTHQTSKALHMTFGCLVAWVYMALLDQDCAEEIRLSEGSNPMVGIPYQYFLPSFDQGDDCSICMTEAIGEGDWVYSLPCQHQYHRRCLVQHLQSGRDDCPLCRCTITHRRTPRDANEDWQFDTGNFADGAHGHPVDSAWEAGGIASAPASLTSANDVASHRLQDFRTWPDYEDEGYADLMSDIRRRLNRSPQPHDQQANAEYERLWRQLRDLRIEDRSEEGR